MFGEFKRTLIAIGFEFSEDEKLASITDLETGKVLKSDIVFKDFRQGFLSFAPALNELERNILEGKFVHNNNPVMNMCATNAVIKTDPAGNRKLDKSNRLKRIDGMVILAMATGIANYANNDIIATPWDNDVDFKLVL